MENKQMKFVFGGIRPLSDEDLLDVHSFCNYDPNRDGETMCINGTLHNYGNVFSCWIPSGQTC